MLSSVGAYSAVTFSDTEYGACTDTESLTDFPIALAGRDRIDRSSAMNRVQAFLARQNIALWSFRFLSNHRSGRELAQLRCDFGRDQVEAALHKIERHPSIRDGHRRAQGTGHPDALAPGVDNLLRRTPGLAAHE